MIYIFARRTPVNHYLIFDYCYRLCTCKRTNRIQKCFGVVWRIVRNRYFNKFVRIESNRNVDNFLLSDTILPISKIGFSCCAILQSLAFCEVVIIVYSYLYPFSNKRF